MTIIRKSFSSVLNEVEQGERVVVVRKGRPAAAIVSAVDYRQIMQMRKKAKQRN